MGALAATAVKSPAKRSVCGTRPRSLRCAFVIWLPKGLLQAHACKLEVSLQARAFKPEVEMNAGRCKIMSMDMMRVQIPCSRQVTRLASCGRGDGGGGWWQSWGAQRAISWRSGGVLVSSDRPTRTSFRQRFGGRWLYFGSKPWRED